MEGGYCLRVCKMGCCWVLRMVYRSLLLDPGLCPGNRLFFVGLDSDFQVVLSKYVAYPFLGDFRLSCGAVAGGEAIVSV